MRTPINEHASALLSADDTLSAQWHELRRRTVSASEIAAVLGISPYTSEFDLWWRKRNADQEPDNAAMRRGRRCEPLILEDFTDAHPEFALTRVGLVANNERPWQACTPDALAYEAATYDIRAADREQPVRRITVPEGEPVAVVEAKTAGAADEWGESGSDEIPAYYRAQVLWQLDTLALRVAYVAVWLGFAYREYVVEYDETDAMLMRRAATDFLASLDRDEPPDVDAHTATARRLKKLHPSVVDGECEVPATVVRQYRLAKRLRDTAQRRMDLAENRLRAALGDYRVATVDGRKVASRSVYDVRERTQTVRAHTVNRLTVTKGSA